MNKDDVKLMQQFCEITEIEIEIGDWVFTYYDEPPFLVVGKDMLTDDVYDGKSIITSYLILQENEYHYRQRSTFMIEEGFCTLDKKSNILGKVENYLKLKKFRIENLDSPDIYGTIRHSIKIRNEKNGIFSGRCFVKQADKLWKVLVVSCIKINLYEKSMNNAI